MQLDKLNKIFEEADLSIDKFVVLIQLDLLKVAKANLIFSNDARELYKDLLEYVRS